jgi:hypothetical protein
MFTFETFGTFRSAWVIVGVAGVISRVQNFDCWVTRCALGGGCKELPQEIKIREVLSMPQLGQRESEVTRRGIIDGRRPIVLDDARWEVQA